MAMRGTRMAITVAVLMAISLGWGQQRTAVPAQAQTSAASVAASPAEANQAQETTRTSKQKLLDDQAQSLVTMANELKTAVDKTNKNILSLEVVRKAEQIELLAHKMKDQGKK
jgi:hypothetical protein